MNCQLLCSIWSDFEVCWNNFHLLLDRLRHLQASTGFLYRQYRWYHYHWACRIHLNNCHSNSSLLFKDAFLYPLVSHFYDLYQKHVLGVFCLFVFLWHHCALFDRGPLGGLVHWTWVLQSFFESIVIFIDLDLHVLFVLRFIQIAFYLKLFTNSYSHPESKYYLLPSFL